MRFVMIVLVVLCALAWLGAAAPALDDEAMAEAMRFKREDAPGSICSAAMASLACG